MILLFLFFISACGTENDIKSNIISSDNKTEIAETFDVTKVNMKEVDSSAIAYIGYLNGRLVIVFHSSLDRCYVYDNVSYDD